LGEVLELPVDDPDLSLVLVEDPGLLLQVGLLELLLLEGVPPRLGEIAAQLAAERGVLLVEVSHEAVAALQGPGCLAAAPIPEDPPILALNDARALGDGGRLADRCGVEARRGALRALAAASVRLEARLAALGQHIELAARDPEHLGGRLAADDPDAGRWLG